MNHSLFSADRATHRKIVAVAIGATLLLVLVGFTARQPQADGLTRVEAGLVLRAGKRALAAASDLTAVR